MRLDSLVKAQGEGDVLIFVDGPQDLLMLVVVLIKVSLVPQQGSSAALDVIQERNLQSTWSACTVTSFAKISSSRERSL
jgi:uncharacterized protein (UPF0218 family)